MPSTLTATPPLDPQSSAAPAGDLPAAARGVGGATYSDWLLSIGPKLAEFREEDRRRAELHSAHVEAWMDDVAPMEREDEPEDRGESFGEMYARRTRGFL